jgi:hypothetical protein
MDYVIPGMGLEVNINIAKKKDNIEEHKVGKERT